MFQSRQMHRRYCFEVTSPDLHTTHNHPFSWLFSCGGWWFNLPEYDSSCITLLGKPPTRPMYLNRSPRVHYKPCLVNISIFSSLSLSNAQRLFFLFWHLQPCLLPPGKPLFLSISTSPLRRIDKFSPLSLRFKNNCHPFSSTRFRTIAASAVHPIPSPSALHKGFSHSVI